MKKLLLIFITLGMSMIVIAQEVPKQKEVGLVFSNFDNFGLTYKTGTAKSLWRFNTLFISGNNFDESADSLVNKSSDLGFNIRFGKEYRKVIVENFEFRYGADLAFSYNHSLRENEYASLSSGYNSSSERTTYGMGFNLVLGFNYVLNDRFVIGAELLPHFSYITGKSKENNYYTNNEIESDISGFSYGLSNSSALISLSYRF